MQRRDAVTVCRPGVGPGADQAVDELEVVGADGPMQRRRAVGFGCEHSALVARELERRGAIAGLHRCDERRRCGMRTARDHERRDERGAQRPEALLSSRDPRAQISATRPVLSPSLSMLTSSWRAA